MFNSKEYEWAQLTAIMGGRDVTGIRGVEYKESKDKEYVYGKGNKPRGIQHGNFSYDGKIKLLQSELIALETAANIAGTDLLDIRLNIVVSYGNPSKGDIIHMDILQGVEFTEKPKNLNQGDKFMEVELPFMMLDVANV